MADEWHVEWLKEGVVRWNRRRKKVKFVPDLSGLNFYDFLPRDFRDAPKTSRTFEKIDLSDANLAEANLSNLNFAAANFKAANLLNATMTKSNFTNAKFIDTNLVGIDASGSMFEDAEFERVELARANFEGVEATGAVFISTELTSSQVRTLGEENILVFPSRAAHRDAVTQSNERYSLPSPSGPPTKDDGKTRKNRYDVFFGTNRVPKIERDAVVDFTGDKASELSFGICEVIVPEGHKIGSLGSPLFKRLYNRKDDRLKLENLIALNEELFFAQLRQSSNRMKIQERPTIFVHGFNNSFEAAVLRAAQIGYDLRIGQGIGLFSWPSKGKAKAYSADEATVEVSKYYLADFIEKFVANALDGTINVIAHSMGCRCLLGALEVLSNGRPHVLKSINQTILAAADVDASVMHFLGKHPVENATRTTSYVSDKDKALKVSKWLHDFPRVGVMPPTYVMNGMDTVIVNNLDLGKFSHGYVGTSRTILNDIFSLLKDNSPPSDRFSVAWDATSGQSCWRLKD